MNTLGGENPAAGPDARLFPPLRVATPAAWLQYASTHWRELLVDHANCEKKAASTALSLLFTYAEDQTLTGQLSRLAREELRHFEQVQRLMTSLDVPSRRLSPSRYAERLRQASRQKEPGRRVDLLICGGLIEARSCERFAALAPRLPEPLGSFYRTLGEAELRHFSVYFRLGEHAARADALPFSDRVAQLAEVEGTLIEAPDRQFRFHSGTPQYDAAKPSNMSPVRIVDAANAASIAIAKELVREYAAWLSIDLEYQNFEQELATFPGDYAPPHGALLLARVGEATAGCVALRRLEPGVCEMKRLWVREEFQGHGVGRALAVALLERAVHLGYRHMRLDTLPRMASALALYRSLGFREIPAYYPSPVPGTLYLEVALRAT